MRTPLLSIFKPRVLGNTLSACIWMAGGFIAYYAVNSLFATHLQKDLNLSPAMVATPIFFANLGVFLATCAWGWWSDRFGRRWAMIIPAAIGALVTPFYLLSDSYPMVAGAFILQGAFLGAIYGQNPAYLSERFPTEVRATASGFIYHQGAIWGGLVAPVLTYLAVQMNFGFAMPMMISTILSLVLVVISVLLGPETKGKRLTADLEVIKLATEPAT